MSKFLCMVMLTVGLFGVSLNAFARCTCYLPDAPEIPDGVAAESSQMMYAKNQLASYQRKMTSYRQCLEACIVDADKRENRTVREWNATVDTYNAKNEGQTLSSQTP